MTLAGVDTRRMASAYTPEAVRAELARILDSAEFSATPRRRKLLEYLVEETLAGRGDTIKGYTIGVNLLGRGEDFDPDADPTVRLEARSLRRDLDSYYVSAGRTNPLRISIPKGHYVPEITNQQIERSGETISAAYSPIGTNRAVSTSRFTWLIGGILVAIAVAALSTWTWQSRSNETTVSAPAVAVLPFDYLSKDGQDQYLAAGISSQIVADLNRFPDIRIFTPQAGFTANPPINSIELGKRLNVSYVVAGELRTNRSSINVAARLIDTKSGEVMWSETYERQLAPENVMAMQSDIAATVASALGQPYGIIRSEITRSLPAHALPSMSSYECVLRAYDYRRTFSRDLRGPITDCLEKAIKTDPNYAEAWVMLGWLYLDNARFAADDTNKKQYFDKALNVASHANVIDGKNVMALKALSSINHYMGNIDEGQRFAREALNLNPNDPDSLAQLGWRLAVRGNFAEGIPYLQKAIDRTVNPPGWYFHMIAIDHMMNERYADMLAAAKRGAVDNLSFSWALAAIAYAELGDEDSAGDALERMKAAPFPTARAPAAFLRSHQATNEIVDAFMDGMHKAGWREPGL